MDDEAVVEEYAEFWNDILRSAEATGEPQHSAFFDLYSLLAADNGDCGDLTYVPVRTSGRASFQIDAYAIDLERGELQLAICDFRTERELQSLNADGIKSLFGRVKRFVENAAKPDFVRDLEETSPTYEVAIKVLNNLGSIDRIRCVVFTNARVATRKKFIEADQVLGKPIVFSIFDFVRYCDVLRSQGGVEPVELDLTTLNGAPLPCLEAHVGDSEVRSYLVVVPGALLADIYGLYGARLMEQNVRTFLQARTKVNRGILRTIEEEPEMFFAYNNGITATATHIGLKPSKGGLAISSANDLQIVNGGQTTASLLYARDKAKVDLSKVFVQMKLSVVDQSRVEKVVPSISRYANTQNRISEADFFSSHPFHIEMQQISRRLSAPAAEGALVGSKWFYERARGQHRNEQVSRTAAERRRFESEFPKDQLIQKTDLAKYEVTFDARPHVASLGAQKCFLSFAEGVSQRWETNKTEFNENYFRNAVAHAIVFRWTDWMVGKSSWYQSDRGYKANIITYTIAWLVHHLRNSGKEIDLDRIWKLQAVPAELQSVLRDLSPSIADAIKETPAAVTNVSEYAKQQQCWVKVSNLDLSISSQISKVLIGASEAKQIRSDAQKVKKIDNDIAFEISLLDLRTRADRIRSDAQELSLVSPKVANALTKLRSFGTAGGRLSKPERDVLRTLFERLEEEGFPVTRHLEN